MVSVLEEGQFRETTPPDPYSAYTWLMVVVDWKVTSDEDPAVEAMYKKPPSLIAVLLNIVTVVAVIVDNALPTSTYIEPPLSFAELYLKLVLAAKVKVKACVD